jgi:hypothetical protein
MKLKGVMVFLVEIEELELGDGSLLINPIRRLATWLIGQSIANAEGEQSRVM